MRNPANILSSAWHCCIVLVLLCAICGCAVESASSFKTDRPLRPAQDVPDRFVIDTTQSAVSTDSNATVMCRNPMLDPRDGTRLRLYRSGQGESGYRGDYEVPAGRYGVKAGELLRLECGTGRVLGIVKR